MAATSSRIVGYDVARAMAILGMVLVNYTSLMEVDTFSPSWLKPIVYWVYGRAAVVFVMLAGISVSMMASRSTAPTATRALQKRLFIRSALLLIAGLLLWRWWEADILHFYALFIGVSACTALWPHRRLLRCTALLLLISLPVSAALTASYDLGDTLAWLDTQNPVIRLLLDYVTSCYYPLFPWLGIFLGGMVLGRREPTNPYFWRRLCLAGLLICLMAETVSALSMVWAENHELEIEGNFWFTFLRSEAFPVTPMFILSAGGSGLVLIGLCRMISSEPSRTAMGMQLLAIFGQLSLTMYMAHIAWGIFYKHWLSGSGTGITSHQMVLAMGVFDLAGLLFALGWRCYFQRGPLEMLFHRLTQGGISALAFLWGTIRAYPLRARS